MARGGRRDGAGRPDKLHESGRVSVRLGKRHVQLLDALCTRHSLTRSDLLRLLIEEGRTLLPGADAWCASTPDLIAGTAPLQPHPPQTRLHDQDGLLTKSYQTAPPQEGLAKAGGTRRRPPSYQKETLWPRKEGW